MPVLDALGRLCRGAGRGRGGRRPGPARADLARADAVAREADELVALRPGRLSATRDAMLRELVEALERLRRPSARARPRRPPLVRPCDSRLLEPLARRDEPARLLVLGTYSAGGRPGERAIQSGPLIEELRMRAAGAWGSGSGRSAPRQSASTWRPPHRSGAASAAAAVLCERTAGIRSSWRTSWTGGSRPGSSSSGTATGRSSPRPTSWRGSCRTRCGSSSRRTLAPRTTTSESSSEAASVAGPVFAAEEVAAALGESVEDIEARAARLADRGRLLDRDRGAERRAERR